MKKGLFTCFILSVLVWNMYCVRQHQVDDSQSTVISGKIFPANGAEAVLVVDSKDTLEIPVVQGAFSLQVKPETYQLIVNARAPYQNVSLGNLDVRQQAMDVGEIILQQ